MSTPSNDEPTRRFNSRVDYYVKYRPRYPVELVPFFRRELGLAAPAVLADIGSGTGKLTRMLLETGYTVHGIEPNEAMRRAAEIDLEGFPGFVSRDGSAEATGLGPASLDAVVAAQAFHWFRID